MLDDPIIIFTNSSKAMVCFSIGYFLFDTCNMISNGTRKCVITFLTENYTSTRLINQLIDVH